MKTLLVIFACAVLVVSCDNNGSDNAPVPNTDSVASEPQKPVFYNAQDLENTLPASLFDTQFHMPSTGAIVGIRAYAQREYETFDFGNIIVELTDFGLAGAMQEQADLTVGPELEKVGIVQQRSIDGVAGMVVLDTLFSRGSLRYHVAPSVSLDIQVSTVPVQDIRWLDTIAARIDVAGISKAITQLEKE